MEENKNIEQEELKEFYTADEVIEIVEGVMPKVNVETEECQGVQLDKDEFQKGVTHMSFVAGQISALVSAGLTVELATDFVMNERNIEHNQKLQEIINKNQLEVSKIQMVQNEKAQI